MQLLRSSSNRMRGKADEKEKKGDAISGGKREMFVSIDEAVQEHRKSMGKRPNTSAGVEERRKRSSSKTGDAAKQAPREPTCLDDFQKIGRTVEYTDGLDTFRFPTPELRPSPSPSPMLPRSATFQHIRPSPTPSNYQWPRIGVAIGSPSHAPPSWGRSYTTNDMTKLVRPQPPSRAPPRPPAPQRSQTTTVITSSPEQRKKKSSWKAFGSLFRKSSNRSANSSLQCMPGPAYAEAPPAARTTPILALQPSEATSPVLPSPRPAQHRSGHSRSSSTNNGLNASGLTTPTFRTSHMPNLRYKIRGSLTPSPRITPTLESPDVFGPAPRSARYDSQMEKQNRGAAVPRPPRLDLDIPKSEFERYSVMFEKLLSNEGKPSLLERRQSRMQNRQSGIGADAHAEESRPPIPSQHSPSTTTPLTRSLSIQTRSKRSLAVPDRETPVNSVQRPNPRPRSKTAPPVAISPATAPFSRGRKPTLDSSPDSMDSNTIYSENSLPPTPTTVTTCTDTDSIRRVLEQKEPAWDMITSQPPVKILSPLQVVDSVHEPYPRVKSPEDLERQIVQVSVARQVSVSRAKMRVSQAVNTKQPLRPRVVEMGKNRKSTVGVLMSAEDEEVEPLPGRPSDLSRNEENEAPMKP